MEGTIPSLVLLLLINLIIVFIIVLLLFWLYRKGNKLTSNMEELGVPDESKRYDRNFLKLAEQVENVLEKLNAGIHKTILIEGRIYFIVKYKPKTVDQYRVYIEIVRNHESSSTVNLGATLCSCLRAVARGFGRRRPTGRLESWW